MTSMENTRRRRDTAKEAWAVSANVKMDEEGGARSPWLSAAKDYLSHCSMHGVRYVVEDGRHWSERLLWAAGVAAGLMGMVLFMGEVWQQVAQSPTVVSVASTQHSLLGDQFPAVTICSVNKVQRSAAVRFYRTWGLESVLSPDDFEAFVRQLAGLTQPERFRGALPPQLPDLTAFLSQRNLSMRSVMMQLAPSCESLIVRCLWKKQVVNCSQLFSRQKTDAGFCCSFNYNTEGPVHKVEGEGYTYGLTVLVDPLLDDYYVAAYSFHGLQVLVHSPVDYPFVAARSVIVRPRTETFMQVDVTVTESTAAVLGLQPARRPCVFSSDEAARRLGLRYSAGNCLLSCRARFIHDACGCTPYHYLYDGNTRECGLEDLKCLSNYSRDFNWLSVRTAQLDGHEDCLCRPLCDTVWFQATVTAGDVFNSNYDYNSFFSDIEIVNQTILHVYLKELLTLRYRRDVLYNWNSLIGKALITVAISLLVDGRMRSCDEVPADIFIDTVPCYPYTYPYTFAATYQKRTFTCSLGGSAGLFLGCSLLSVLELVYFVTLRALCALRRRRAQPPQPRGRRHHVLPV